MLAEDVEVFTGARDVTAKLLVIMAEVVELVEAGIELRVWVGMIVVVGMVVSVVEAVGVLLGTVLVLETTLERVS